MWFPARRSRLPGARILPVLRQRPAVTVLLVILFSLAYGATGWIGLKVSFNGLGPSPFWPPAGLALAAVLLFGARVSPLVLLGYSLLNAFLGRDVLSWLPSALANMGGALIGAALLRRTPHFRPSLERLSDVGAFVLFACFFSPILPALVGAGTLIALDQTHPPAFSSLALVWWAGDATGDLIFAPLVFLLARAVPRPPVPRWRAALLLGGLVLVAVVTFGLLPGLAPGYHFAYLVFPALLLVVARLEQPGAIVGGTLVALLAAWGTAHGQGPFVQPSVAMSVLLVQAFTAVVSVTGFVLGAAVSERRRALELRNEFISSAAHELKTPLTTLSLELDALQAQLRQGAPPAFAREAEPSVRAVEGQLRRLVRLIEVMLDLSRLSTGRLVVVPEPVDLGALVRHSVERTRAEFAATNVPLAVEAPEGVRCVCDPTRIDQVVSNLLSNALKYGEGRPVRVEVRRTDAMAEVRVVDQGIGISAVDQERIFERFQRAVADRAYGGLGLGLYITRQILHAHGGSLQVESDPGRGATFLVRLPLAPPDATPRAHG